MSSALFMQYLTRSKSFLRTVPLPVVWDLEFQAVDLRSRVEIPRLWSFHVSLFSKRDLLCERARCSCGNIRKWGGANMLFTNVLALQMQLWILWHCWLTFHYDWNLHKLACRSCTNSYNPRVCKAVIKAEHLFTCVLTSVKISSAQLRYTIQSATKPDNDLLWGPFAATNSTHSVKSDHNQLPLSVNKVWHRYTAAGGISCTRGLLSRNSSGVQGSW